MLLRRRRRRRVVVVVVGIRIPRRQHITQVAQPSTVRAARIGAHRRECRERNLLHTIRVRARSCTRAGTGTGTGARQRRVREVKRVRLRLRAERRRERISVGVGVGVSVRVRGGVRIRVHGEGHARRAAVPEVLRAPLALLVAPQLHALLGLVDRRPRASTHVRAHRARDRHGHGHRKRRRTLDLTAFTLFVGTALLLIADRCRLRRGFGLLAPALLFGVVLGLEAVVGVQALVLLLLLVRELLPSFLFCCGEGFPVVACE